MRALTFNAWGVPWAAFREERFAALADTLGEGARTGRWDVALLQEVWMARHRRLLGDGGFGHRADADRIWRRPLIWLTGPFGIAHDSGLLILSRYPISAVRRHIYRRRGRIDRLLTDGEATARKSALAARVETPHLGPVWIVNTHLIACYPEELYESRRAHQLRELADFCGELAREAPVVMGGDLNVGPNVSERPGGEPPSLGYLPSLWDELVPALFAGYREAPEAATSVTYAGTGNSYGDGKPNEMLDHLFAGPGLAARDGAVTLDRPVVRLGGGRLGHLSDHFGFACTFERA